MNPNVIRLWVQPTQIFQQYQGLLPFVALSQTDNPEEALREAAQQIETITDKRIQRNITTATYIISGLALNKEIIQRLLRREIMKESVTYQEILLEGKVVGKAETANQIALNMLRSGISLDLITQFTGLSLEQIQKLS